MRLLFSIHCVFSPRGMVLGSACNVFIVTMLTGCVAITGNDTCITVLGIGYSSYRYDYLSKEDQEKGGKGVVVLAMREREGCIVTNPSGKNPTTEYVLVQARVVSPLITLWGTNRRVGLSLGYLRHVVGRFSVARGDSDPNDIEHARWPFLANRLSLALPRFDGPRYCRDKIIGLSMILGDSSGFLFIPAD
jgi:hypothetical protein